MTENLELREWIAVNVMGAEWVDGTQAGCLLGKMYLVPAERNHATISVGKGPMRNVPPYELTWNDAALVVEAMRGRGWFVEVTLRPAPYSDTEVVLCKGFDRRRRPVMPEHYSTAPTAPLAICLAAKAAIEATK